MFIIRTKGKMNLLSSSPVNGVLSKKIITSANKKNCILLNLIRDELS